MPHSSLKLIPGVDQNKTPTLNEAAISESQLIRFIPDRTLGGIVQKLGGWTKFVSTTMGSIVRALLAWQDSNSVSYLAVGAEGIASGGGDALQVIMVVTPGSPSAPGDITPKTIIVNNASIVAPSGPSTSFESNQVVITDTGRGITSNDVVDIHTQISIGGIVIFGQYQCYNPGNDPDAYSIYALNAAGNPDLARLPATITEANGNGTQATLTYDGSYIFPAGTQVVVSGMTGGATGYNGTWTVVTSGAVTDTTSSVTFLSSTTAALAGPATVKNIAHVPYFTTTANTNNVLVTLDDHGYEVGDIFPILADVATTVGGITLSGNYTVTQKILASNSTAAREISRQFIIQAKISASSTASAYENGGLAYYLYYKGQTPPSAGYGYGIRGYGGTGSPTSGYGGTISGATPTYPTGTPINAVDWTLDNWGEILLSCPLDGPVYEWSPITGNALASVIAEAPPVNEGIFVAMPQRQIIAWGSTFNGIKDPLLIRWCDVEDYNSWIPTIINQAGSYRIPKGSRIIQCIQGPQQGLIWTDLGCWAMQYVGPPYVYQFSEVGTGCGLIGRKAATSVNGVVYWMGPSQFYRLSGNGVEPIRCPVWDVIFQDLDTNNLDRIRVAPNSRFGEITWYYPTNGNGGENSAYVKYNFVLDQWDYGANDAAKGNPYVARSAWINESVLGPPIGAGLNQYLFQHETSPNADGAVMRSSFQTGYFALSEADVLMFVDQIWPDMKWGYFGGDQNANVNITFHVSSYPNGPVTSYGPYVMTSISTYLTPRFRGRLVAIEISDTDTDINAWWRLGNIRYRVQQDGKFL
jgi:hypothetical protein